MGTIDPARLLTPVAADRPCGDNLEYDADFLALEQASRGKPERQMGSEVLPAEDPDWKTVRRLAVDLCARTKDLRVAVLLCSALARTDGLAGIAAGLEFVRGLVEQFWPALHPELDPDDGNDPTLRVNCLLALADPASVVRAVREAPIVRAPLAGTFCLRDMEAAIGRAAAPAGSEPPSPELIRAAFLEAKAADLQADLLAAQQAQQALQALGEQLNAHLGSQGPNLQPLGETLQAITAELGQRLDLRGVGGDGAAATAAAAGPGGGGAGGPQAVPGGSMQIRSREDVITWLDRMCDWFQRNEPSSPVPILLQRARRLVNMNFLDVIRDLVPDAIQQAEMYRGPTGEES